MMGELVEYIAKAIVKDADEVAVAVAERGGDSGGPHRIEVGLKVATEDYGRVIGKNGQTIDAIRKLATVAGRRQGTEVTVDVIDIEEWNRRTLTTRVLHNAAKLFSPLL